METKVEGNGMEGNKKHETEFDHIYEILLTALHLVLTALCAMLNNGHKLH